MLYDSDAHARTRDCWIDRVHIESPYILLSRQTKIGEVSWRGASTRKGRAQRLSMCRDLVRGVVRAAFINRTPELREACDLASFSRVMCPALSRLDDYAKKEIDISKIFFNSNNESQKLKNQDLICLDDRNKRIVVSYSTRRSAGRAVDSAEEIFVTKTLCANIYE